jgi:hypothetical protein
MMMVCILKLSIGESLLMSTTEVAEDVGWKGSPLYRASLLLVLRIIAAEEFVWDATLTSLPALPAMSRATPSDLAMPLLEVRRAYSNETVDYDRID